LRIAIKVALASAVILSACSSDNAAIENACDAVETAVSVTTPLPTADGLAEDPTLYSTVLAALDAAHAATDGLSGRERRQLAERCGAVSDTVLTKLRQRNSQHIAVGLVSAERRISEADAAIAALEERRVQAEEGYSRTSSVACQSLEKALDPDPDSTRWILADLESMAFRQRLWFDDHWARFEEECPVVLELSMDAAIERLGEIVAIEDENSSQNETMEMLAVLAEMERAWNSISVSDRLVVCSQFRQNGVQTAQNWIRESGYGRPEWAFVFLSQAC
jgi:hypothetical protein